MCDTKKGRRALFFVRGVMAQTSILPSDFEPCFESKATISAKIDAGVLFDTIFQRPYEDQFFCSMGTGELRRNTYETTSTPVRGIHSHSTVELNAGFLNGVKSWVPSSLFTYDTLVQKSWANGERNIVTENVSMCGSMLDRTVVRVLDGPQGCCFVDLHSLSYCSMYGSSLVVGPLRTAILSQFCFMLAHASLYANQKCVPPTAVISTADVQAVLDRHDVVVLSSNTDYV